MWFLHISRFPRTVVRGAGAYGAFKGLEHLKETNEDVNNWFENLSGFEETSLGVGAAMFGIFLANLLYNIPTKPVNRAVGGPLL